MGVRTDPYTERRVVALRKQKFSYNAICYRLKLTKPVVWRILKEAGLMTGKQGSYTVKDVVGDNYGYESR